MYTGYEKLANEIIIFAVTDYRKALKTLKAAPTDVDARSMKRGCERFFKSKWFCLLSDVDGEYILRKIKEEGR